MSLSLLLGVALAATPPPLCAALLPDQPDVAAAMRLVAAGADVSARCSQQVTIEERHRYSLAEMVVGVLVPPLGAVMLLNSQPRPVQRTRHPAPLDLAIRHQQMQLVDALLAADANPLQAAPPGELVPLGTAIVQDLTHGGDAWTRRVLQACDLVPAMILGDAPRQLDLLLGRPLLLAPLLAGGMDPQGRDATGRTWLLRAARQGDLPQARLALARGADPNLRVDGETPLGSAVDAGPVELVALLIDAGADPQRAATGGPPLLSRALTQGDPEMLITVLALGAPVDGSDGAGPTPLEVAAEHATLSQVELLLERGAVPGPAAILAATRRGDLAMLSALLEAGGDPNAEGTFSRRPLHHALDAGRSDIVHVLLAAGADPGRHATSAIFHEPPPIRIPMEQGDTDAMALLLPHVGGRERLWLLVEALSRDDMEMAAHISASGVDHDAALVQLSRQGDANARAWLRTQGARFPSDALADICATGHAEAIAEALLDGADPNLAGGHPSRRPAELLVDRGDATLLLLLAGAGGRLPAGWDLRRVLRSSDAAVLEGALQLGAAADGTTVRAAVVWDQATALEVLARHVHDPRAWAPLRLGRGPLRARAIEIHAEKVAAKRARRTKVNGERGRKRRRRD